MATMTQSPVKSAVSAGNSAVSAGNSAVSARRVVTPMGAEAIDAAAEETPLTLSAKAIEMAKKAIARRGTAEAGLRLGVRGGGCSGASYVIEFVDKVRRRDQVFDFDGLRVVIDPKSLVYLRGAQLDYEVKLMQHGFKWRNPNEQKGCGCGESFAI